MASAVLIIDIQAGAVSALVLSPGTQETKSFSTPLVEGLSDALRDALQALFVEMDREGIDKDFSQTLVGLAPDSASLRVISLPFTETKKIEEVLPFELSETLVEDVEDMVIGALALSGGQTLAASVEKSVVESVIEIFDSLDIAVSFVGFSLFYKDKLLCGLFGDAGTAALIDSTSIVVIKDSSPVLYSYVSDSADLKFIFASLSASGINVESFYSIGQARQWLEELGIDSVPCEPYNDNNIGTLALKSLHDEGFTKDPMNFRKGRFVDKRKFESTRKSLRLAAVLVLFIASFWSANIYSRVSRSADELVKIDNKFTSDYSALFVGEGVVDPFYQMQIKIKELAEEKAFVSGGIDVLGTLKGLSDGTGADSDLKIFEVNMRPERVVARGETMSFDNANKFKDVLLAKGVFNDISLTDIKKKSAGRVGFSIAITLEDGK